MDWPMLGILKSLAARLPRRSQQTLKRFYFGRQVRRRTFRTWEPEYDLLPTLVSAGDWAIDVGANIGHYTTRLSALVGPQGRVIAFEPVPETLELLAANVALLPDKNVTIVNSAASDHTGTAGITIPPQSNGSENYYQAHLTDAATGLTVLCLPVDALALPHRVRLVKIDAEGHEMAVLQGMRNLLVRDSPVLIVEDNSSDVPQYLRDLGYNDETLPGSSNRIYRKGA
jgi:FkbM family methyltransferase